MFDQRKDAEPAVRAEPNIKRRWALRLSLIGAAILACSLVLLINRDPPVVYAFEVHEALARRARGETQDVLRITGMLVPGSLVRSDQSRDVAFQIWSLGYRDQVLTVRAACVVPISEREAEQPVELWVQGRWGEGEGASHFAAEHVWVRHRYEGREFSRPPKLDGARAQP